MKGESLLHGVLVWLLDFVLAYLFEIYHGLRTLHFCCLALVSKLQLDCLDTLLFCL